MIRAFLVATTCLVMPALASAEEVKDNENDVEEIVVWGTEISSDSLGLDKDSIEVKQADHLSDLLRSVPGIDIGGTHSVNTRINFRGLDDRDLNVYIDGAQQRNYIYHHIGNLLINPDILKSVDIQLGTNSVVSGGLGGAVRFETKGAADLLLKGRNVGGRVAGSWNSNRLWSGSATLYGQIGDLDLLAYYDHIDRGNFEDGSGRSTIGSDGLTQNVLAKVKYNIADNQALRISYDRYWDQGDYTQRPDMGVLTNEAITGNILLPTEYRRETINAGYDLDLGDTMKLSATVYTNDLRLYRDESDPGIPRGILTDRQVEADNWGINLFGQSNLGIGNWENGLSYGMEFFRQKFDYIPDVTGNAPSQFQQAKSFVLFLEDRMSFANDRFVLRPGVRYNHHITSLTTAGQRDSYEEVTYGIGAEAELIDGLRLIASYTTLFQGPELAEPFGETASSKIINPDLKPETGDNLEAGLRFDTAINSNWDFRLTGNYFRTEIEDYIGEVASPTPGASWDANIGTAKIDGFEIAANLRSDNFGIFAGFSSAVLDGSQLIAPDTTESLREIGDKLTGEISWTSDSRDIFIGANAQHVFGKPTITGDVKPDYTVVNLSGRWDNAVNIPGLSLIAGIDNLFDETYTSHASRSGATFHPLFGALILNDVEPGQNFKLTAAYRF